MEKSTKYIISSASAVIILAGLKLGADLVNPILVSILLAICIAPLPEWLNGKGLNKSLSLAISFVILIVVGFLTIDLLVNSMAGLSKSFPVYEQKLTEIYHKLDVFAQSYNVNISELVKKLKISPEKIVGYVESLAGGLSNMISSSVVILMLMIFFIMELVGYGADLKKGSRTKMSMHDWLVSLLGDVRKYITICALEGVILGGLNFILLLVLGVDFAFLWAFFSFLMNFVPNIGFVLSFIPPALIALITLGPTQALIVIAGFWLINFVVENVLGPIFMKKSINVSLLNSFLSLLIWGWILGLPGAILGIPLTLVLMKIYNDAKARPIDHQA